MPNTTGEPPRPICPACQGHRIQKLTWSVKSQKNDGPFDGPITRECMTCGHVWRVAAGSEPPRPPG